MLSFLLNRPKVFLLVDAAFGRARSEEGSGRYPGGTLRRAFPWLILGVGLTGVLLLITVKGVFGLWSKTDQAYSAAHQRLLESLGPARPVEARLSGGYAYGYYRVSPRAPTAAREGDPTSRGGGAPARTITSGLPLPHEITKAIQKAKDREPSPENQATLAILNLVQGQPEEAVRLLRKAHDQQPADPRFLNDLAAASLAVHEATGDPWSALEAIEVSKEADQLQPSPPARFNMALALERLDIRVRAIAAWERYLELDSNSSWAQEANQRLGRLKEKVAKAESEPQLLAKPATNLGEFPDNPWARRQLGERVLLTRWAERTLAGRLVDAKAALAQAEAIAATLSPDGGRLLNASIDVIHEAEQAGDQARLNLLARGHQIFGQAFLRMREERAVEGRSLIAAAIRDLQDAETPFALRARVLQAWLVPEPDWGELRQISEEAEARGFTGIVAEERRIAAYWMTLEGRKEGATDVYQDSQQRYASLGEWEMATLLSIMRTEGLTDLGRNRESSIELASALTAGYFMADPWDRYSVYVVAAVAASSRFGRAAVELRLEAANACYGLPERPLCAIDSWLRVAALTSDAGVAEDALQQADILLLKAPLSDGKARTVIDLTMSRARWLGKDDREKFDREDAADLYKEAAKEYEARKLVLSAADAHSGRAQILKGLGRSNEAVEEYRAALQTFRLWDQGERFRPERAEKRSPDILRSTYEALIGMELDLAGNSVSGAAFLLSEEMRDRLAPRRSAVMILPKLADIPRLATAVPKGTAVVEYALFEGRAAAWILTGQHLDQVKLKPPNGFAGSIASLEKERDLGRWKRTTGTLYQSFLAPVIERLPAGIDRLVIVPDSQLYGLPFRGLWSPKTGHFMDESYTLSFTPSIRQLLFPEAVPVRRGRPEILSVGFGKFLQPLYLRDLPGAEGEASSVLGIYGLPSNSCSVNDWNSFRLCAPKADVIHLATHATANSSFSWLAFPGETVSIEKLWRELPDLPLHPVVVLAACESVAAAQGGEGLGGLARPFLASGAREVVGNLWEVEDAEGLPLSLSFHHFLGQGFESAAILQMVREKIPNWESIPWVWAKTEVLGIGSINESMRMFFKNRRNI